MKLFGKKESVQKETGNEAVKVLGGGCANCHALEASAKAALAELGLPQEVGHITDFGEIAACGVLHTPALMVDGKVVASGRVLSKEEAKDLIEKARSQA